jgi:hypothetical protein
VADAKEMAAALKALGYTIVTGAAVTNAGKEGLITATEAFATQAQNAEAAVFYFSGHGIQVGEDNFLMPSDTPRLTSYTVLKNRSVHLREAVMVALEEAKAKTKVIILDCCRENPFAAQVDQALGQIGKSMRTKGGLGEISGYGPGFFLAFATSPGTIASDGNGQIHSPFTAALLMHLKTSASEDITPLFRKVKATVRKSGGEDQVPWTNDSLDESFFFAPEVTRMTLPAPAPSPPSVISNPQSLLDSGTVGKVIQIKLPGGELMKFCYCPPGSFMMGSPKSEEEHRNDEDQVQVRISRGFWMAQTECTQAQWEAVIGDNPSEVKGRDLPVEKVSWEDVQAYLSKLNGAVSLPSGWKLELPTEAQWEYACRAGTESMFSFGDRSSRIYANIGQGKPSAVASYAPNAWNMHDMHGNVWEWCRDWYGEKLPGGTDPAGPAAGLHRVNRGGTFDRGWPSSRAAQRAYDEPNLSYASLGFRPALVPTK